MKFNIGHGPSGTANWLTIHSKDEGDQGPGSRKEAYDISSLVAEFRSVDLEKSDIIRARFETHLAEPMSV